MLQQFKFDGRDVRIDTDVPRIFVGVRGLGVATPFSVYGNNVRVGALVGDAADVHRWLGPAIAWLGDKDRERVERTRCLVVVTDGEATALPLGYADFAQAERAAALINETFGYVAEIRRGAGRPGVSVLETVDGPVELDEQGGTLRFGSPEPRSLAQARASLGTMGELRSEVTVGRLLMFGVLALAVPKTTDSRQLFLVCQGPSVDVMAEIPAERAQEAHRFVGRLDAAIQRATAAASVAPQANMPDAPAAAAQVPASQPSPAADAGAASDLTEQVRALRALYRSGVLTVDEFYGKREPLLARLGWGIDES